MNQDPLSWQESLMMTYQAFVSQMKALAPQLIGAAALLIAGWVVAHILRIMTRKIVIGFDSLFQRAVKADGNREERMKSSYAAILSKVVYWTTLIFVITAVGNFLGWRMFSNWMNNFIIYLPNLISGLLIILGGYLLSQGTRTAVQSAANSAGLARAESLAQFSQFVVLFTACVIGVKQIGINVDFLTNVMIVIIGTLLLGGTLAFSLGAKNLIANLIGAQYVRKHCRVGEYLKMGSVEGSVVEVTQTSIVLDSGESRTLIPAKHFQEQVCNFTSNKPGRQDHGATQSEKAV